MNKRKAKKASDSTGPKKDLRSWVSDLIDSQRAQVEKDLKSEDLTPKDRLQFFEKLLTYALPKQQATTATVEFGKMSDGDLDKIINGLTSSVLEGSEEDGL